MEIIHNPKCKQVMLKLLEPGFKTTNEELESLLQHLIKVLEGLEISDDPSTIVINEHEEEGYLFIVSWLKKAVDLWDFTGSISSSGFWFISNLTTYLCKNEQTFICLNKQGILAKILKLSRIDENPEYFDVELIYYCQLFSVFLNHKSGYDWILLNNLTDKVTSLSLNSENPKIFKECCEFIAIVLETSIENDELVCRNILKKLIVPVLAILSQIPKDNPKEINISEEIIVHLNLLNGILEKSLELCCSKNSFKTFKLLQEKFSFNKYMEKLKSLANNENLVLEIDSLLFLLIFFELGVTVGSPLEPNEKRKKMHKSFYELSCISKEIITQNEKLFYNFKLGYKALVYFRHIRHLMPAHLCGETGQTIKFEIQLVALQVIPVLISLHVALDMLGKNLWSTDELREELYTMLLKELTEFTLRLIIALKQRSPKINLNDGITALSYIRKSKNFYSRKAGNYLIQALIIGLGDIVDSMKNVPEKCENLTEGFISNLFDAIIEFIEEFHVNWNESIKSLSLTELTCSFLSFPISSPKLVAKGLQLLNIAISRHMSPTLALLVDNSEETLIDNIGSMLLEKLVHQDRDIKKNALDIVYTIALNSKSKFPSFRKVIQDNKFPHIVFTTAINDIDSSVKITALRCLQQMLQADQIRKDVLNIPNIYDQLIQILYLDEDVSVRSEASNVITKIHDLDTMENTSDNFCDIMSHIIFANNETKLKMKTLDFWHKVIDVSFRRHGMVDGQFPEATFSKQLKRIIHFDKQTIISTIDSILNDLSQNGCFAIFIHVFKGGYDFDMCTATKSCFDDLIALLKQYKITNSTTNTINMDYINSPFHSLSPLTDHSGESLSPPMSPASFISEFESIDVQELGILDNSEFSLNFPVNSDCILKGREVVTPNNFLKFVYGEFETCCAELKLKENSENRFNSLLDRILSKSV